MSWFAIALAIWLLLSLLALAAMIRWGRQRRRAERAWTRLCGPADREQWE